MFLQTYVIWMYGIHVIFDHWIIVGFPPFPLLGKFAQNEAIQAEDF